LLEAGIAALVGSHGDSYDNALAETLMGLYKAEVIHHLGSWCSLAKVELATLEWVWLVQSPVARLLKSLSFLPPAKFEERYHEHQWRDWHEAACGMPSTKCSPMR
jgi:hypothetical protein